MTTSRHRIRISRSPLKSFRRAIVASCGWWLLAVFVIATLQPFLSTHFRWDGWEDEPTVRIATPGQTAVFEQDDRAEYSSRHETTLFLSPVAGIDVPGALDLGLASLLVAIALAMPLAFVRLAGVLPWRASPRSCQIATTDPPPWRSPRTRLKPPSLAPPPQS